MRRLRTQESSTAVIDSTSEAFGQASPTLRSVICGMVPLHVCQGKLLHTVFERRCVNLRDSAAPDVSVRNSQMAVLALAQLRPYNYRVRVADNPENERAHQQDFREHSDRSLA